MAEKYRFFDAVQDENGQYDREYNAQEFTDYFKALVTTGVMKGAGNELAVAANGSNMITTVNTGIAFLLGRYYENDSPLNLTHDTETLGNSRIDRIVIRMDLSTEARYVKAFIKKGVPSTNPVAPVLTQTSSLYEISLAQVKVVGGQTFVAANAVTDERGIDVICPWAGSNILPNFDAEGLEELVTTVDGKANKQQGNRISATLTNGWTGELSYYIDDFGVVHISGLIIPTMASKIISTLPNEVIDTTKKVYGTGFVTGLAIPKLFPVELSKNGQLIVWYDNADSGNAPFSISLSFRKR